MPAPRRRHVRGHSPWEDLGRVDLRLEVPTWTKDALCTEIGVDVFFSEKRGDPAVGLAKQVCADCPVRAECLEWALTFTKDEDTYGIFGGAGPRERDALRRERNRRGLAA